MINLHDHVWQAELPSFPFLPALLKPPFSPPRYYFYSGKQQKILRKKVSGEDAVQLFLKEAPEKQNYLIMEIIAGNHLTYGLGESASVKIIVQKEKVGLCIARLEEAGVLIGVQFGVSSEMAVKVLMEYKKQGFWSSQSDFTLKSTQFLYSFMMKLWMELPTLMKISSKCLKISLVLSTKAPFDKFSIVWCNQLLFSKPQFYQIHYKSNFLHKNIEIALSTSPKTNTNSLSLSPSKTLTVQPISQLKMCSQSIKSQKNPSHPSQKEEQPSIQNICICKGCNIPIPEETAHEAEGALVIQLRRRRRLPILGLLDEFLLICQTCYNKLE